MYGPDVSIFTHVCVSGKERFVALRHSMASCISMN